MGGRGAKGGIGTGRKGHRQAKIRAIVADAVRERARAIDVEANKEIIDEARKFGFKIDRESKRKFSETFQTYALAEAIIDLMNHEEEYGAFRKYKNVRSDVDRKLSYLDSPGVYGKESETGEIWLGKQLGDFIKHQMQLDKEQRDGFKVKTDGSFKSAMRYTSTHEYGHLIADMLYARDVKSGAWNLYADGRYAKWCADKRNEVIKIAIDKYGYKGGFIDTHFDGLRRIQSSGNEKILRESLSKYSTQAGLFDGFAIEFFSEAFVQYKLGDGPLGKAYGDWLAQQMT